MVLLFYLLVIIIGTVLVIAAILQKKRDGNLSQRSKIFMNVGTVMIVFSLAEKLPEFISVILNFWRPK